MNRNILFFLISLLLSIFIIIGCTGDDDDNNTGDTDCDPETCDEACISAGKQVGVCRNDKCECLGQEPDDDDTTDDDDDDVCTPDCEGKECGDDGCGGICGECGANKNCSRGICKTISTDLTWVNIPAGSFEMGCSPGDSNCYSFAEPRHTVSVQAFEMTETEITQLQYEYVMGENPSDFEGCPDCPVEQVDWYKAKEFCEVVGGRLLSEAEWEYAARAGATTKYYCGEDESCLDNIAWYSVNNDDKTHPVGQKDANAFGLYDMLGNVEEWNEDCWHEDYNGAPNNGEVWEGGDCGYRVLRGGSWRGNTGNLCTYYRNRHTPDSRIHSFGFRCAR